LQDADAVVTEGCNIDTDCPVDYECVKHGYCSISKTPCNPRAPQCASGESCVETGDAIGHRVFENEMHYSPLNWYTRQGFNGTPSVSASMDGFETIQDGSTFYINTPYNLGTNAYRTAMNVLSVNPDANQDSYAILTQLLANMSFGVQLTDQKHCVSDPEEVCHKDTDCQNYGAGGDTCDAQKSKVRRDVLRMSHIRDIEDWLRTYRFLRGTYPTLSAGTYVPSASLSTWPSWQDTLSNELARVVDISELYVDPLNKLTGCPADANPETCWNEQARRMDCPAYDWWSYGYEFVSQDVARIYMNIEDNSVMWFNISGITSEIPSACLLSQGEGNVVLRDSDNDGFYDDHENPLLKDNCPFVPNGDCVADPFNCDIDKNGELNPVLVRAYGEDIEDPADYNEEADLGNQADTDADGIGDACDKCWDASGIDMGHDDDNDEFCSKLPLLVVTKPGDTCPLVHNPEQRDFDDDIPFSQCRYSTPYPETLAGGDYCGGDACDLDADSDGFLKANDCQDFDSFPECQNFVTANPADYTFTFTTQSDTVSDVIAAWVFEGDTMFAQNNHPITFPEQDERRNDFILSRSYASSLTFSGLPAGKYTLRIRSDVLSGPPGKAIFARSAGVQVNFVDNFFYTTPGAGCTTRFVGGKYELCHGETTGNTIDELGGFVDILVEVTFPGGASSRCSQFVNLNALEVCDVVDNDCDGLTDQVPIYTCSQSGRPCSVNAVISCEERAEGTCAVSRYRDLCSPDRDGDSWSVDDGDCDDADANVYPDFSETHGVEAFDQEQANTFCRDLKDNDCDGNQDWRDTPECVDADNDRWAAITDCDDRNAQINHGMDELCANRVDDDCNGRFDLGDVAQCRVGLPAAISPILNDLVFFDDSYEVWIFPEGKSVTDHSTADGHMVFDYDYTVHADGSPAYRLIATDYEDGTPMVSGRFVMRVKGVATADVADGNLSRFELSPSSILGLDNHFTPRFYISDHPLPTFEDYCDGITQESLIDGFSYTNPLGAGKIQATLCGASGWETFFICADPNRNNCPDIRIPGGHVDLMVDFHSYEEEEIN
ncbi:MAG TPA: putative metal-binding motif-containing protein, partial [Patescibacteria group bacterium]|nr:putative metal-binding motif-containing protein [Patescibacteria group bacterium]